MRVYHPQAPYQGNPIENVFCVADDMGIEVGVGYVMFMYQPHIFPERPVNMFLQMDVQPQAKHMLFGALYAQALRLKAQFPGQRARIYTECPIDDGQAIEFCRHNGLKLDDAEDLVALSLPDMPAKLPMSFEFGATPLHNEAEQNAFLMRINAHRVAAIPLGMLDVQSRMQRFMALAVYKNGAPIGEILVTGEGDSVYIIGMYVQPSFRKMGVARAMVNRVIEIMQLEGVQNINAFVLRRSPAQQALARTFRARLVRTTAIYPGINVN